MRPSVSINDAVSFIKKTLAEEKKIHGVVVNLSQGGNTVWIKEIVGPNKVWIHAVDIENVKVIKPYKESK